MTRVQGEGMRREGDGKKKNSYFLLGYFLDSQLQGNL